MVAGEGSSGRVPSAGLPQPGDEVSGYVVEGVLGTGGMGAVFQARHRATGAEAAIKLLRSDSEDPATLVERFRREVAAMARVDGHAGIVRVRSAGTFGPRGIPFVIMDLVGGTTLEHELRRRRLAPMEAIALVEKLARALHHCHVQGIVHRDLKPGNVLIRAHDGEPVVTDFGLAFARGESRLTRTGAIMGTLRYMAPEQASGGTAVDARADVYALGAILFEALTGSVPFDSPSEATLMKQILLDPAPDPCARVPGLSPDVGAIVLRCLAKDRLARYRTALELMEDLARARRGEPTNARPRSAFERAGETLAPPRRTWFVVPATIALVLLVVLGFGIQARLRAAGQRQQEAVSERSRRRDDVAREAVRALEAAGYPAAPPEPAALESARQALAALELADKALAEVAPDQAGRPPLPRLERWSRLLADPRLALGGDVPAADDERILEATALLRLRADSNDPTVTRRLTTLIGSDPAGDLATARAILAVLDGDPAALGALRPAGSRGGPVPPRWLPAFERTWERGFAAAFAKGASALSVLDGPLRDADRDDPALRPRLVRVVAAAGPDVLVRLVDRSDLLDAHARALGVVRSLVGIERGERCPRELEEPVRRLGHELAIRITRDLRSFGHAGETARSADFVLEELWALAAVSNEAEPEMLRVFVEWLLPQILSEARDMRAVVQSSAILLHFGFLYPWHPGPGLRSETLEAADPLPKDHPWSAAAKVISSALILDLLPEADVKLTPEDVARRDLALSRLDAIGDAAQRAPESDAQTRRLGAVGYAAIARALETRIISPDRVSPPAHNPTADRPTLDLEIASLTSAIVLGHPSVRRMRYQRANARLWRAQVTNDDEGTAPELLRLADEDVLATIAIDDANRALQERIESDDGKGLDEAAHRLALANDFNGNTTDAVARSSRAEPLLLRARLWEYKADRYGDAAALEVAVASDTVGLELMPDLLGARLQLATLLSRQGKLERALEEAKRGLSRSRSLPPDDIKSATDEAVRARAETLVSELERKLGR